MRSSRAIFLAFASTGLFAADSPFEPLWNYQGTWQFTMNAAPGSAPVSNKIQNDCFDMGQYFLCQQTVDGKVAALLAFTPSETKGSYYTQPILPDGHAAGRGDLEIQGDRWTYPSRAKRNTTGSPTFSQARIAFTSNARNPWTAKPGKCWHPAMNYARRKQGPAPIRATINVAHALCVPCSHSCEHKVFGKFRAFTRV